MTEILRGKYVSYEISLELEVNILKISRGMITFVAKSQIKMKNDLNECIFQIDINLHYHLKSIKPKIPNSTSKSPNQIHPSSPPSHITQTEQPSSTPQSIPISPTKTHNNV